MLLSVLLTLSIQARMHNMCEAALQQQQQHADSAFEQFSALASARIRNLKRRLNQAEVPRLLRSRPEAHGMHGTPQVWALCAFHQLSFGILFALPYLGVMQLGARCTACSGSLSAFLPQILLDGVVIDLLTGPSQGVDR